MENQEPPRLDWNVFGPELDNIVLSAINLVHRERPGCLDQDSAALLLVEGILRITDNTHKTIRFLVADVPKRAGRKPEFALSVGPLARTILDSLFTLVFAFQDLPSRAEWYMKAGWRDIHAEHQRFLAAYSENPEFESWLEGHQEFVDRSATRWGITGEELDNPSSISWWPLPGQMLKSPDLDDERREFLRHLNTWYYKNLSQESHVSLYGLIVRSGPLIHDLGDDRADLMERQASNSLMTTVQLVLSLVSEVSAEFSLGLSERLAYVWTTQTEHSIAAKELYEMRYRALLGME